MNSYSNKQIAEFLARGWTDDEVTDLMGGNLLRVLDEVDAVKEASAEELPSSAIYDVRTDLPASWAVRKTSCIRMMCARPRRLFTMSFSHWSFRYTILWIL